MKFGLHTGAIAAMAGAMLLSTSAFGATVGAGTFSLGGTAVGTTGGITPYLTTLGDGSAVVQNPTLGVFSNLTAPTVEAIKPLTVSNGVIPGTSFDLMNFVTLTDGIGLDATSIPIPTGFSVCSSSGSVAIGYECMVNAASPVLLTQTASGVSAALTVNGVAHYLGQTTYTPFVGLFEVPSTNFSTIAAFETYFNSNGNIPAVSYSASFTTTSPVPEPASLAVVALGLIGLGFYRRGKKSDA